MALLYKITSVVLFIYLGLLIMLSFFTGLCQRVIICLILGSLFGSPYLALGVSFYNINKLKPALKTIIGIVFVIYSIIAIISLTPYTAGFGRSGDVGIMLFIFFPALLASIGLIALGIKEKMKTK